MPDNNEVIKPRRTHLDMKISIFDVPPCGDVLVLAKHAPVGPKAAQKMMDTICPGLFELVEIDDDIIEALIVKRQLFLMADKQSIVSAILEETKIFMSPQLMAKIEVDIKILVSKTI